jgi:small subunit ribosomal protein S12e
LNPCGVQEAAKALNKCQAHLYVLAPNGAEPVEVKLVEALCAEHQTNPIKVDDNRKLGEWSASAKVMERENKVAVCDG